MPPARQRVTVPTEEAGLVFDPSRRPVGFTSAALAHFDGSAEPVVRELIQNSLDAADKAGRPAEIAFNVFPVPYSMVPGLDQYEEAFELSLKDREEWNSEGLASHDENMIVERIQEVLGNKAVDALLCIDNGHGLDGQRMDRLLTEGNSGKGEGGAGSFGVGHNAAFAASSMRYVLYGARYRNNGELASIVSGHAVLASHPHPSDKDERRGADGYWFRKGQLSFTNDHNYYSSDPPALLAAPLDNMPDTGTVVCVLGFNDFHRDDDDPTSVETISRVAASNFSAAIFQGSMRVDVHDERSGEEITINAGNLGQILEKYANRLRPDARLQITGEYAHRAWRTMSEVPSLKRSGGEVIWCRSIENEKRTGSRVHLFRKGMWITSSAPRLHPSDFAGCRPFDAVIVLNSGREEELVRDAEGPEHRGIDRARLSKSDRKELDSLLDNLADRIREAAGQVEDTDEYTPPGFAEFSRAVTTAGEKVTRARPPSGGGKQPSDVLRGEKPKKKGKKRQRERGTPRRGTVPRYRTLPPVVAGPKTMRFEIQIEDEGVADGQIGISLSIPSGSDASCEQRFGDSYLHLRRITTEDGIKVESQNRSGAIELLIPAVPAHQRLDVEVASEVSNLSEAEIVVYRRKAEHS